MPVAGGVGIRGANRGHGVQIMFGDDLLKRSIREDSGQGITEYGCILAFVALLIVLLLSFAQGSMASALTNAYSIIESTISFLDSQAS
jgi:Flp pilus assembly pilin Flp